MPFSIVVAMSTNRVIGIDGALPWHLPNDLKRFKTLTSGHTIIMGRKTFDSIGRVLPNRKHIVLTRDRTWSHPDVDVVHSMEALLACQSQDPTQELFIIGGGELYQSTLPYVDTIYLTEVAVDLVGDTVFPELNMDDWEVLLEESYLPDDKHDYSYCFKTFKRHKFVVG